MPENTTTTEKVRVDIRESTKNKAVDRLNAGQTPAEIAKALHIPNKAYIARWKREGYGSEKLTVATAPKTTPTNKPTATIGKTETPNALSLKTIATTDNIEDLQAIAIELFLENRKLRQSNNGKNNS